jgi:NHL repeat
MRSPADGRGAKASLRRRTGRGLSYFTAVILAGAGGVALAHASQGPGSRTVAGTGISGPGGDGGLATSAQLDSPRGVAALRRGGFLVADRGNNRVRRVSADGTITTVAGTGQAGFSGDGMPAAAAQLDFVHAAVPDRAGGVLIADTLNQRIRRVSPAGIITTVAGSGPTGVTMGAFGGDGGPATSARLFNPHGVAALSDGGFLVADSDNHRIRRVSPSGEIKTLAGNGRCCSSGTFAGDGGPATSARLFRPFQAAPVPSGGFLIADTGNNRIRRVSPNGTIRTVAGTGPAAFSGDGGLARDAMLNGPHAAIPAPDGGVLIADTGNDRVRRVTPYGRIVTIAGGGVGLLLDKPKDLSVSGRDFLVADEQSHRIVLVRIPLAIDLPFHQRRVRRARALRVQFSCTVAATIRVEAFSGRKRAARVRRRVGAGEHELRMPGRFRGRYRLALVARTRDGQVDSAALRVRAGR